MKQVLQNLRSGETTLEELPAPGVRPGHLLIATRASLISAGTERSLVEFGKAGLLGKVRAQPEKVRQVLEKIRTDGLLPTLDTVFNRLDEPLPLGYCNAGTVLDVGTGVTGFKPGDRVVSNGTHAEIVCVPRNLCARIPDAVGDEDAAFTVLSSIALQGLRLVNPAIGERVAVFGLGLIGLVTVQLLQANGCAVLGIDFSADRLRRAQEAGATPVALADGADPIAAAQAWTEGRGVDAVIITASAKTDDIIHQAATMCRKRGRIVLVGVVGLNLRRADFYEKELSFQVSCSYGPGRYDDAYERSGQDYPFGFVRWTEQRNFEAILDMLASRRLRVAGLVTHRIPLDQATEAYRTIAEDRQALGVVLQYPAEPSRDTHLTLAPSPAATPGGHAVFGVIGAGNFSKMTLMPALSRLKIRVAAIADLNAAAATHLARKYGAEEAGTDYRTLLASPAINTVLIAVGHHLHARLATEVLKAGKHAFVEKPLAMNVTEVRDLVAAARAATGCHLLVGFNRRYSPHIQRMGALLRGRSEPLAMTFTANAGIIPPTHWVHDPVRGGGRIIGEACHYFDLMLHLTRSPIRRVSASMMERGVAVQEDKMAIVLAFEDGSVGTVNYFANGARSYPKETLEVFSEGRVLRLDNFRRTTGHGFRGFRTFKTRAQDKGHAAQFAALADCVAAGGEPLIPLSELINVTLASFAAMTAAREHRTVDLAVEYADAGLPG